MMLCLGFEFMLYWLEVGIFIMDLFSFFFLYDIEFFDFCYLVYFDYLYNYVLYYLIVVFC